MKRHTAAEQLSTRDTAVERDAQLSALQEPSMRQQRRQEAASSSAGQLLQKRSCAASTRAVARGYTPDIGHRRPPPDRHCQLQPRGFPLHALVRRRSAGGRISRVRTGAPCWHLADGFVSAAPIRRVAFARVFLARTPVLVARKVAHRVPPTHPRSACSYWGLLRGAVHAGNYSAVQVRALPLATLFARRVTTAAT